MNVTQLIDLVGQLSFNRTNSTLKERANYLRYLNLANLELWQILINSKGFFQKVDVFLNNEGIGNLPLSYYYIKAIFSDKQQMTQCVLADVFNIPQGKYTIIDNMLNVNPMNLLSKNDPNDGLAKKYVTLLVLPSCKELVEIVDDPDRQTDTPVFPEPHHLSLVHGALYYLYVSGKGFTEKIKYQIVNWENSKKNLQNLYNNG